MTQIPGLASMEAFAFLDRFDVDLPPEMAQLQIPYSLCTGDLGLVRLNESRTPKARSYDAVFWNIFRKLAQRPSASMLVELEVRQIGIEIVVAWVPGVLIFADQLLSEQRKRRWG
jgi:hypothetical protein